MSDFERITAGENEDDRPIGLELPFREQIVDEEGRAHVTTEYDRITFASAAMLPREVRALVIKAFNGGVFDPEEFLIASAADEDNRDTLRSYLDRDGISLAVLDKVASRLVEKYAGRGKAKPRR